ncbi:MAG TPA: FUSC family protein [Thermoleophilaceae bacterium]|nr:FUSC family protein [Thermoleophilaceae bacterium]
MNPHRLHDYLLDARRRLRASAWPVAQASIAAALSWWIAHRVLGHSQPFFAPIAAAIALSTARTQRARRSTQMVTGVLLGIAIAEALQAILGTSTFALGVTVFVTMLVALAVGVSFIGEGMMFANQAAASAILVIALHRHGTGGERAVDAVVGGGVAVVIGVLLFPADPLRIVRNAENAVLATLADGVREVLRSLRERTQASPEWTLAQSAEIHARLAQLDQARGTAWALARVAPRRWPERAAVAEEIARVAHMDLLANTLLTLIRTSATAVDAEERLSAHLDHQLSQLSELLGRLADAPRPWPAALVEDAAELAQSILEDTAAGRDFPVVTSILVTTARDLRRVVLR